VVFFEFLRRIGYCEAVREHLPFSLRSPNAIDPVKTFTAFLLSVVAGARRFAHTSLLRADTALHALLGISRFPIDDTVRNLFKRFGQGQCQRFFSGLWSWQLERLPECAAGYSLDLDSTVFERYGHQQGALRGPNPRKHGRPSHHPLVAVLAEAHFLLHGWLRSGNCGTSRGVVEFLKEALALLPENTRFAWCAPMPAFLISNYWGFWSSADCPISWAPGCSAPQRLWNPDLGKLTAQDA